MSKWNFQKELARKSVHLLSVSILLIYFILSDMFNRQIALIILVLILMISLEFEYLRIEIGKKIPILNKIWAYVRRDKEKGKLGGEVYFLIGAILVLSIFDLRIAIAAILMTIFGDLSAAIIGTRFGMHYLGFLKDRAWEGIFAEFFVDMAIGSIIFFGRAFSDFSVLYNWKLWIVILTMSLTATIVETVIYKMDDNLLIPVFAAFYGQITLILLNYFF